MLSHGILLLLQVCDVHMQEDPSHSHLTNLAAEMGRKGITVRIIIAPLAKICSQKIANLQVGIKVPYAKMTDTSIRGRDL